VSRCSVCLILDTETIKRLQSDNHALLGIREVACEEGNQSLRTCPFLWSGKLKCAFGWKQEHRVWKETAGRNLLNVLLEAVKIAEAKDRDHNGSNGLSSSPDDDGSKHSQSKKDEGKK
jgi:hypothetical protein